MLNIKRLLIVSLISLSVSFLLINCGGSGDGSGGVSYDGSESQVVINDSNAESLALSAYENSNSMGSIGDSGSIFGAVSANGNEQITKPYSVALAQVVRDFLQQTDITSASGNNISAAVSESGSMSGECGGNVSFSGTANETTGSFNITASFSSYCTYDDGTGTVTVNGTIKMVGSMQSNSLQADLTFSSIEVTQSDSGDSVTASGTMYMDMDMSSGSALIRMTMVVRDESAGKTYKVENLVISYNSATLRIDGRFYDPDYGYVDIATTVEFHMDVSDDPTSGEMVITGASSTKAKLIFVSSTQYQVKLETDGDDLYDEYDTGPQDW